MTPRRPRLPSAALGLALLLAAVTALAQPSPHDGAPSAPGGVPPGDGTLRGRVVHEDGSPGEFPAEILLYALPAQGAPGLTRARTDANGAFVFEGIASDPGTVYLVGVRVGDVPHGARARFAAGQTEIQVELRVSAPDADTGRARLEAVTLRLDRACAGLRVGESHRLSNPTERVIFVPEAERDGRAPILDVLLPETAGELETPLGALPQGLVRDGRRVRYWGPLYPGEQELEIGYGVREGAGALTWSFAAGAPRVALVEGAGIALQRAVVEGKDGERALEGEPPSGALAPGESLSVSIEAGPAPEVPLRLQEVQTWLELDDAALVADQRIVLAVDGEQALESAAPLLCLPLPEGAGDLRFSTESLALGLDRDASGALAVHGPLPPGESALALRYQLPARDGGQAFRLRFPLAVPLLSVLIADTGVRADTERLHRRRPVRSGDRGYLALEGFQIEPGEEVAIELSRAPLPRPLPRLAAVGFALLAAAAAVGFLSAPLRDRAAEPASDETQAERLEAERESLYSAIRDLDDDLDTGKLTPDDHARLRAELRARAVELLARQKRAETPATPAAASAEARCPDCRAALPAEARFCPRCGIRLPEPA